MPSRRAYPSAVLPMWALLLACGGCTERGRDEPKIVNTAPYLQAARSQEEAANISSELPLGGGKDSPPAGMEPQRPGEELAQLAGEKDTKNHFLSTVIIVTDVPATRWKSTQCSGALVASRLVLTAGHCVCKRRKLQEPGQEDRIVIDGSACTASATVKTVVYDPPRPDEDPGFQTREYKGEVRPHPELKILLDAEGNVLSSKADLAVIHLGTPVRPEIPLIELADTEVEAQEALVMIGYGLDEASGWVSDHRHFIRHEVTRVALPGDERILFNQPRRHVYKGDSGGPALREREGRIVLVGILGRGLGSEASLIDTYPHRVWVRDEIHRAANAAPATPR